MTPSVEFLRVDDVLRFHMRQIEVHGGAHGIRDVNLLESALAQPCATFGGQYLHPSLASMAAAYLFHLCKNHPFVDGNKRVALATATVFLKMNGQTLVASQDDVERLVLGVADSSVSKEDASEFMKTHIEPRQAVAGVGRKKPRRKPK